MKQILSEKNIAAFLFVLVMIFFSFAHEDSKKRSGSYKVSASVGIKENTSVSNILSGNDLDKKSVDFNSPALK